MHMYQKIAPVYQDLADLDALTACSQSIFHGLSRTDDGNATQPLGKVHPHILMPCGRDDCLLCEGQVPQACLHHLQSALLLTILPIIDLADAADSHVIFTIPSSSGECMNRNK